ALRRASRPAEHRRAVHAHARGALDRLEDAQQERRAERAVVLQEPRHEVDDAERAVGAVGRGLEHVRVLEIALLAARAVGGAYLETTTRLLVEQARENRLRIELRQAAPDDLAALGHQSGELAVPDQSEVLETHGGNLADADCSS